MKSEEAVECRFRGMSLDGWIKEVRAPQKSCNVTFPKFAH